MAEVKHTNFLTIQGWMVTDLHLSGGELIAYALVYQFTQSEAGRYVGGPKYLASWLSCSVKTARIHLHSLSEKGLLNVIEGETEGGVSYRHYTVNHNATPLTKCDPSQNFPSPLTKCESE